MYDQLNFRSLHDLGVKELVVGLPKISIPKKICEVCLICKQSRKCFKSQLPMRSTKLLCVMYSKTCGPFETSSLGGDKYFISFVDENSRMMWLRIDGDGGGKFTSQEFKKFYESNGITHEVTTLYTPQRNGLVDRRNRAILRMNIETRKTR